MAGHRRWEEILGEPETRPGYTERAAKLREQTLEEIRLFELQWAEAVSQIEVAGHHDAV